MIVPGRMPQGGCQYRKAVFRRSDWQWQPTLTAHDPNPPITLENAAAVTFGGEDEYEQLLATLGLSTRPQRLPVGAFLADDEIVPAAAAFLPDEDYWLQLSVRLAPALAPLFSADDEVIPKVDDDYWLQLLARQEAHRAIVFSADDEIIPQPVAFVPDEEYGPRLVLVDDAQFIQLWGSDDGASAPAPAAFVPEEEYWQRVLLLDEPQFAQMWGSDGAASTAVPPVVPGVARYIPQWRRRRR